MWAITNDGQKVGTASCNFDESKAASLKHRFRLVDDDCDSQRAFAPLDDFGKGYAGCTEIHYFTGGAWRQL